MAIVWSMKYFKADAEKVHDELLKIDERNPQNIVDYAKAHPKGELHKCFTWDDTKAANEWRKQEARQVVKLLVYETPEGEPKAAEAVKIRVMENVNGAYEPVKAIVKQQDVYQQLLAQAYADLQAFKRRYSCLTELEEILALIE